MTTPFFAAAIAEHQPNPTGVWYDGNKTCSQLGTGWTEFKIDGAPTNGNYTNANGTFTVWITNSTQYQFDFRNASDDVYGVFVKAGNGGYLYNFTDGTRHGDDLRAGGKEISHISFCYIEGGGTELGTPDVMVEKTVADDRVDFGDDIVFTLKVTNVGSELATGVVLNDTLPAISGGWTVGGANGTSCAIDAGELTCSFDDLAVGDERVVTLTATADDPGDCGAHTNYATVTATDDSEASNNGDDADVYVVCADVSIEKTASDTSIGMGDDAVFTLVVTSNGPDAAENVVLTDTLQAVSGGWTVGGANGTECAITGALLTCDFGDLQAGETRTITLTASTSDADCGTILNIAFASADLDVDETNDEDDASVTVSCVCPRSPGYWKNHDWPDGGVTINGVTYTQSDLKTPKKGDASAILLFQLIAAMVNVENDAPDTMDDEIAYAISIYQSGVRTNTALGQEYVALAAELDAYNNGLTTGGCA
ncbi:MAG TPA: DUF11 domain-containing protein [Candidatus Thermoplasmatota archaeon]|nr:DUF11 domain-containing protein [Candidatus Thermoplasmatota archaeon]